MASQMTNWVVEYDPCDAPLAKGTPLSTEELRCGIKLGAYVPGMRVRNKKTKVVKVIKFKNGKLRMVKQ